MHTSLRMETLSPDEQEPQKAIPVQSIDPDKLSLKWCDYLLKGLRSVMDSDKLSLRLGAPFEVTYRIVRWPDAIRQAIHILEKAERFEDCAAFQQILEDVQIRIISLTDEQQDEVDRIKRNHTKR